MDVVVLDGATLNPGDLSWEPLRGAVGGRMSVYERTPEGLVAERARDAAIVVTNKAVLPAATLEKLPALKCIAVTATGYNIVDVAAAKARGIAVCNVPAYSTESVAQHTFALLLELASRVGMHAAAVREGAWARSVDFSFTLSPLIELAGRTLGIVGFGTIGQRVGAIGHAMGMRIVAARRRSGALPAVSYPVESRDVRALFAESDVVSLHCPLTAENARFVNAELLGTMKPSAFLINTARGGLIDEAALAAALRSGALAGAAADVLSTEPPAADNPLLAAPNCILTPHVAWASGEARKRCMAITVANVTAFVAGRPQNVVN